MSDQRSPTERPNPLMPVYGPHPDSRAARLWLDTKPQCSICGSREDVVVDGWTAECDKPNCRYARALARRGPVETVEVDPDRPEISGEFAKRNPWRSEDAVISGRWGERNAWRYKT